MAYQPARPQAAEEAAAANMIRPPHGLWPKGRAPSAARLDLGRLDQALRHQSSLARRWSRALVVQPRLRRARDATATGTVAIGLVVEELRRGTACRFTMAYNFHTRT